MRRAFVDASLGGDEGRRRFLERYPNGFELPPNRFATHFIMLKTSELYRLVSAQELTDEDIDLELLGIDTRD